MDICEVCEFCEVVVIEAVKPTDKGDQDWMLLDYAWFLSTH